MHRLRVFLFTGLVAAITVQTVAAIAQGELPRFHTNQSYIEDVTKNSTLPAGDTRKMFSIVLGSLPDRVKVYPTENYYYFYFYHGGIRYAGNFRLDPDGRDQGKINFAYFVELNEWISREGVNYALFGKEDGIVVEKLEPLLYRVTDGGKSVLFELNDLSAVIPPSTALGPDDKYIGPIFDESGIRFFLIFNTRLKLFHYVLDETIRVADELVAHPKRERLLIGRRTGFAYYRDHKLDRKILVGVYGGNTNVNNYFDGPFDQLPDNFIKGDELRDAIIAYDPSQKGKIDRYGNSPDGSSRYLIGPYIHFKDEAELEMFDRCANDKKIPANLYHACFAVNDGGEAEAKPAPAKKPQPKGKAK